MKRSLAIAGIGLIAACSTDSGIKAYNSEPQALITSHSDDTEVEEDVAFTLRGKASDADHSPADLLATWFVGTEVLCEGAAPDGDGATECEAVLGEDETEIILEVQDPMDGAASASVSLVVISTEAPTAVITSPGSGDRFYADQRIDFLGIVSDIEDEPLDLDTEWSSSLDGVLDVLSIPDAAGEVVASGFLTAGTHILTLTATDTIDKIGIDQVEFEVGPPNSAPSCAITAPDDEDAGPMGELVVFEGSVGDVDVGPSGLTITWASDKDDELGTSTPDSEGLISFATSDLSADTHTITLSVTDEMDENCTASILYTVGSAPEITITAPTSGTVANDGDRIEFTATIFDNEDLSHALMVQWESDIDGELSTDPADSAGELSFNRDDLSQGTHTIQLTVTDTDAMYTSASVSLVINGLPGAAEIDITPNPAYTANDLNVVITADGIDPEGDPLSYSYAWFVDGVASSESTTATLPAAATRKDQTWRVDVISGDGTGEGDSASAERTIQNTAPILDSVDISPAIALVEDDLICTPGAANDDDDDPITFSIEWTIDGVASTTTETTLPADETSSGQAVFCTVTPNDGTEAGAPVDSETVTIDNTVPTIDSVAVSPNPAYAGDELSCSYAGYADPDDPEGERDESTYAWQVNGIDVGTGTTLSTDLVRADEVVCSVTPSDGEAEGTPVSATLTVSNTAPWLETASIAPNPATVAVALVCIASGYSDADGDPADSRTQWTINGADAGTDTLLSDGFTGGDEVTCIVTPSDGFDDGLPVTDTLTIDNTGPEVTSIAISPSTPIDTRTTLTCTATATDDDGETPDITFEWTNDGAVLGTDDTLTLSPSTASPSDTITCAATATDGDGASASDTASVSVDNTDPVVDSIHITPTEGIISSTTLSCSATASDADGDTPTLRYVWTDAGAGIELGTETTLTLSPSINQPGDTIRCTVTATDVDGGTDSDSASVTIENSAPEVTTIAITPDTAVDTATTLVCAAEATDPDGDTPSLSYAWLNTSSGASLGTSSTITLTPATSSPADVIACTATAIDAHGDTATDNTSVTVDNTDPRIESVSISPSDGVETWSTLTCTAIASDADGDDPTLNYQWTNETTEETLGTASSLTLTPSIASPGDAIACTVIATDADGGFAVDADAIIVDNLDPEITTITITPDTDIDTQTTLVCTVTASDDDGDELETEIVWINQSDDTTLGTESEVVLTATTTSPGDVIECTVTVTDPSEGTDSATATVTVINTDPEIASVSIDPDSEVGTSDTLTCIVDASDADGDTPTITYEWTNDTQDTWLSTEAEVSLTPETIAPDDRIRCSVVVSDSDGGTDTDEDWLTIGNATPEVTSVSIVPSTDVRSYTSLTCTATATDPDGDETTLSYVWTNLDSEDVLGTDNTLDLDPAYAQPGQTIQCTATARDEFGGTNSSTDTVEVENTDPVLTEVTISPDTEIDTATTLTCAATATDDDDDEGDSLSIGIVWTNETQGTDLGTDASVTLSPSISSPLDQIRCTATVTDEHGDTDSDSADITVENTDPTVTSVAISPDSDIDTSTTLTCTATGSDADGDTPTISYTWANVTQDTDLGEDDTVTLTASNSSPSDVIRCTATSTDSDGGSASDIASVTVENTDPEITGVTVSPSAAIDTSTELTCTVTASDADGGTPEVAIVWTNDTDGSTLGVEITLTLGPSTSSPADEITCSATATDADGGTDSDSDTVTVENTDPEITSVSISPDSGVDTSTTLTCSGTATDADEGTPTITYAWTNDTDGTSLGSEESVTLTPTTSSPDDIITCTATATDADDGTDAASASITVENTDPELTAIAISPSTDVVTSSTLTCSAEASDADGDTPTIAFAWTNSTTGDTLGSTAEITLTPTTSSPDDTITCTATATDPDEGTASDTTSVTVENTNPEITTVTISPDSDVTTSTSLTCAASATDDDGDTPTIVFAWTNETEDTSLGTGTEVTLTTANSSPDDVIRCLATATDDVAGTGSDTAEITVENTDPVIASVSISPSGAIDTTTTLTCSVSSSDADGDTPTETYQWTNESTEEVLGTEAEVTLTPATAQPEHTVRCTATVADADGGTASDSAEITVDNTAPEITAVSISPDEGVVTSTDLSCSAEASDDDEETPSISYAWTNTTQGTELGSEASLTLTPTTSSPGDEITCTATATDDYEGEGSDSASITVENTAPEITDISISPDEGVVVGTTLTCSATASDDDGSTPTFTYRWNNATETTLLGTGSTVTLTASNSSPGDNIRCTGTASDPDGDIDTETTLVTVDNTDPVISSVSISPTTVYSDTSLTCSVDVSDDDGGTPTESYTWTNSTTAETIGTDATITLDSSLVFPGQTVTCSVTVTDSDDGTDTDSDSSTVENTEPTITTLAISPSSGVTTSTELTCAATAEDIDGDEPGITYEWANESTGSILSFGDILTLNTWISSPGDVIGCMATATDAEAATATESTSITVENTIPVVTSISVSPAEDVTTSTTLTCSSTATDEDGGEPDLNYEWTNDTEGTILSTIHIVTLNTANSSPDDEITCKALAKDDDGGIGTDTLTVTVVNTDPTLTDLRIVPETGVTTTSELTCSVLALDPDGGDVLVEYTWTNLSASTELGTDSVLLLNTTIVSPEHEIECMVTATDSDGGTSTNITSVTIINSQPIITSISVSPDSDLVVGTELTCTAEATDDDDEIVSPTYAWENVTEDESLGTDETVTLTTTNSSPGDVIRCTASVIDGYDDSDSDSASVTAENSAPDLSTVTISPASDVITSTELSCSASATDDDADTPTVTYAWTNTTEGTTLGTDSSITLTTSTTSPEDEIVCTATATDADEGTTSDTDSVTLINQEPVISSVELSPTELYTSDTITATVVVTDTDLDDVTINYDWYVAGSLTDATGSTLSGEEYIGKHQSIYVIVTPNDGYGDGASLTSDPVTVSNSAPTQPSVSIDDSGSDLVCLIDEASTDEDGDTISYSIEWEEDASSYTDAETTTETGDTVPEDDVGYNNTWTCTVTPSDGEEDGDSDTGTYDNAVQRDCGSLEFNGDDWVEIADTLDIYSQVTMEMWFKPDNWDGVPGWFGDWYFELCPSTYAGIAVQRYIKEACADIWDEDNWNHVAATWNRSSGDRAIWVNGNEVDTELAGGSLVDRGVIIGASDTSGTEGFEGKISELRLWNRILSSDEISAFMETPPDVNEDGLIAEWEFYAGSGSTIGDITGNEHSGTINGAIWSDECAHGDADGDGYETREDCDDENDVLATDCGSRYWRIVQDSISSGHAPRTGEIEFYADGVEQTVTASMVTHSGTACWAGTCSVSEPIPYGYSNNCSDSGWIWDDDSAIEIDFGSEVHLTELHFWHVYDSTRGANWLVERSSDGLVWVTEATLAYESSSCGWSEFTW